MAQIKGNLLLGVSAGYLCFKSLLGRLAGTKHQLLCISQCSLVQCVSSNSTGGGLYARGQPLYQGVPQEVRKSRGLISCLFQMRRVSPNCLR